MRLSTHPRMLVLALATAFTIGSGAGTAQAQFKDRTLRLSASTPKEHPYGFGVRLMEACAVEKSGGAMKIRSFWDATLGNDLAATQSVRTGTIDIVLPATAPLVGMIPALGVFDFPFLFDTAEEADRVLDGKAGDWFNVKLKDIGVINLAWWENGFRHTTNSRRPINQVEDFQGVKMRVMQNNIYIDTFKALGSNAVPMAFSEVYSALETRTVDGQENPFANIENSKFYEVQKYLTLTRHAYSPLLVLLSRKTWDDMSAAEQKVIMECAALGRDEERRANRAMEAKSVDNLKAKGMLVNEINAAEMQRIRMQSRVIYDQYSKSVGEEAMTLVMDELKRIRSK